MEGLNSAEVGLFKTLKENMELAAGARINNLHVLSNQDVTIQPADNRTAKFLTAQPNATSYPSAGAITYPLVVVDYTQFFNLVSDVQKVVNDIGRLQDTVNSLISQLQG
jgi:hypothetical protein